MEDLGDSKLTKGVHGTVANAGAVRDARTTSKRGMTMHTTERFSGHVWGFGLHFHTCTHFDKTGSKNYRNVV